MEAQVENNVKKKNKETKNRKEKNAYVQNWITENLGNWRKYWKRKNLIWTRAPGLTPRFCGISCRQNSYFLFFAS